MPKPADVERPQVDLTWDSLRYAVKVVDAETKVVSSKPLLKGISGTARRARSLAVMGPSGAGKSTFLNAIAGRLTVDSDHKLSGTGYLNDVVFQAKYKKLVSYVAQDDIVMGKDTPREALTFSYRMRSGADAAEAEQVVIDTLEELKLTACADTMLGIPGLVKGVSGGEKKRTNIGSELINNPMILLLDEPTTGLDSVNALRVGQLLQTMTHDEGRTVICTIHTPSSELYDVFDDILLLADGNTVYLGSREHAPEYFASVGHPVPPRTNPSEFFMTLLQSSGDDMAALVDSWKKYSESPAESSGNLSVNQSPASVRSDDEKFDAVLAHRSVSIGAELALLTGRSWRVVMRDPGATFGRLVQTLFFAVLLALMYANLDKDDNGVTDRAGVLFMQVMNLTFMQMMNALATFPPERAVFLMEQANGLYAAPVYYLSKVIAELPLNIFFPTLYVIITYFSWDLATNATAFFNHLVLALSIGYCGNAFGMFAAALFPSAEIAMTITPVMVMPLMLVGGLFANTERLEPYWIWLNYISFPRYAYKGLMTAEFNSVDLCPSPPCRFQSGAEVLKFYGFDKKTVDTVWFNIVLLNVMMIVLRIIGAIGLTVQGKSQQARLVFEDNYKAGQRPSGGGMAHAHAQQQEQKKRDDAAADDNVDAEMKVVA